jgi:hypothetical protein
MVVAVGADQVGQHLGVPSVGLGPGAAVAAAVTADNLGIDRIDLVAGGQQRPDQQAPVGLDPHCDLRRIHNMGGHQRVQLPPTPARPSTIRRAARTIPSWSSRHRSWWRSPQSTPRNHIAVLLCSDVLTMSQRRTRGALMAVLTGTTSHQPSALLNTSRGTVSPKSSRLPSLRVLTGWRLRRSLPSELVRPH